MNNQEKFTTQSSKLKVQKANSQTKLSCPVTFSVHIIFSSLVSFAICVLMFVFVLKLRTYILLYHIVLPGVISHHLATPRDKIDKIA